MPEINVADAATAGLRLIARRPLSVLTWGLILAVYVALIFLLFGGGVAASISGLIQSAEASNESKGRLIVALVFSALGFFFFLGFGVALLGIVIRTAAIRAELEPDSRGFASMRFGAQEAWVLATSFVFGLVLLIARLLLSIPLGIFSMAAAFSAFSSGSYSTVHSLGMAGGLIGVRLIGEFLVGGVLIWLWLRLVFGVVLTFQQKQFRLFEGWTASRGHVWRMFLTMLLVWLMLFVLGVVLWAIDVGTFFGTVAAAGMTGDPRTFFSQPPAVWLAALTPLFLVVLAGFVVQVAASTALVWGAVARMWTQLYPDAESVKAFT